MCCIYLHLLACLTYPPTYAASAHACLDSPYAAIFATPDLRACSTHILRQVLRIIYTRRISRFASRACGCSRSLWLELQLEQQ